MDPHMNDADWVNRLPRAKLPQKYAFHAIHILAPLRNPQGAAPVIVQTAHEYLRAPAHTEACFELCLRHLNRLQVPWPAQDSITVTALLANRATEALKLPNRFVPTANGNVLDLSEHNLEAPPPSPSCTMKHVELTACLLETTSGATSPASQDLPMARTEWPSQDLPALLGDAAMFTDLPESQGNATMRAESPVSHGNAALRADLPVSHDNAALRADSPMSHENAALRADSPMSHENAALRADWPVSPTHATARADSPMSHENAALRADSPVHENAALRAESPGHENAASDAAAPAQTGRELSRRARRRAELKARKQQRW